MRIIPSDSSDSDVDRWMNHTRRCRFSSVQNPVAKAFMISRMPPPVGLKLLRNPSDGSGKTNLDVVRAPSGHAGSDSSRSKPGRNPRGKINPSGPSPRNPGPCPAPGNGKSKATTVQDLRKKQVLGYAAVAAVRRSLEQQTPSGRAWMPTGPNRIRPRSEPVGNAGLSPRESRVLYSVRGNPLGASVACSLEPTTMDEREQERNKDLSLLVFSGGTAFNGVVEELKKLTTDVTHVLPVSDDGGSTSEILRVLGGPALGDIRSRCLRLSDESSAEALAVKRLLGYRLPIDAVDAKFEWYKIVEGEHELWDEVSGPYRETIRAFLVFFQSQILMHSREKFSFSNGSIGNFFFAGARIFIQSLDAAIFLYSRVSKIPVDSLVLPVICTNDRVTLGCELYDGTFVRGQNEISHPIKRNIPGECEAFHVVDKGRNSTPPLPSPIKRIFYMSADGTNASHEVFPSVNPEVLKRLGVVDAIIYGMGSLYTSICPLLVLKGVGETIAKKACPKLLLLNGSHDRETFGMSASDFVISICDALNRKYGDPNFTLDYPPTAYVNILLVPENGGIHVDRKQLAALGVTQVVVVGSTQDEKSGTIFDPKPLISCIENAVSKYKTSHR